MQANYYIPMSRVVDLVQVDTFDDSGAHRQRYRNWAIRCLRELSRGLLRQTVRYILPVDKETWTVQLPEAVRTLYFIGTISEGGEMVPFGRNINLVVPALTPDLTHPCCCPDAAFSCAVAYEQSEEPIVVAGVPRTRVTVRRVDAQGNYLTEITEPLITDPATLATRTITMGTLERAPCGCVKATRENKECLQLWGCCALPATGHTYPVNSQYNGYYTVVEDAGLVQLEPGFPFDKVYVQGEADLVVKDGDILVPEVAQEAIVAYVRYKVASASRAPTVEKERVRAEWTTARKQLSKNVFRLSVEELRQALTINPY